MHVCVCVCVIKVVHIFSYMLTWQLSHANVVPEYRHLRAGDVRSAQQLDKLVVEPRECLHVATSLERRKCSLVPATRKVLAVTFLEVLNGPGGCTSSFCWFTCIDRSYRTDPSVVPQVAKQFGAGEVCVTEHNTTTVVPFGVFEQSLVD